MTLRKDDRSPKAPTVPTVDPTKVDPRVWSRSKDLGSSIKITIAGDTLSTAQVTLHRPVGVNQLDSEEWVATSSSEVAALLERRTDPGKVARDSKVKAAMEAFAGEEVETLKTVNGVLFYAVSNQSRVEVLGALAIVHRRTWEDTQDGQSWNSYNSLLATWNRKKKEAGNKGAQTFVYENPKPKQPSVKDYVKKGYETGLIPSDKTAEDDYSAFTQNKENKERAQSAVPASTYITGTGVLGNVEQKAIPQFKGMSIAEVKDKVVNLIVNISKDDVQT